MGLEEEISVAYYSYNIYFVINILFTLYFDILSIVYYVQIITRIYNLYKDYPIFITFEYNIDVFEFEVKNIQYEQSICSICFNNYTNDKIIEYKICKHIFHLECINQWCNFTQQFNKCPVCNTIN